MKCSSNLSTLFFLAATSLNIALATASPISKPEKFPTNTMTATSEKIRLDSKVPKQASLARPIPLEITLLNGETTALTLHEVDNWPRGACKVTILNEAGEEATPTQKGLLKLGGNDFALGQTMHSYQAVKLDSGKRKTWMLDLQPLFSLKPGTYFISIQFKVWSAETDRKDTLKVEKIPLTITLIGD